MKPKMTRELVCERTLPGCPHCGASMETAAIKLSDIVDGAGEAPDGVYRLRIDRWVPVDDGGYADTEKAAVVSDCPSCARPSVLVLDGSSVKLIAARTPLDRRFREAQEGAQP